MSTRTLLRQAPSIPMAQVIPVIDSFVAEQFATYPARHESSGRPFDLTCGHNRVVAYEDVMQQARILLAEMLLRMSIRNDWVFMQWLRARELRLLNKGGAKIDLDDYDPTLEVECV